MKKFIWFLVCISFMSLIGVISVFVYNVNHSEEISIEKTFNSANINAIDVSSQLGTIEVLKSNTNQIKVELQGEYRKNKNVEIKDKETDGTLFIQIKDEEKGLFIFNFDLIDGEKRINVYLPNKPFERVNLQSDVGKIMVNHFEADKWNLHTNVGEIYLNHIKADTVHAMTDVGEIHVSNTTGQLNMTTNTGEINIKTNKIKNDYNLQSKVGAVNVLITEKQKGVQLDLDSNVGDVDIDLKQTPFQQVSGKENKNTPTISIKTNVGEISIKD